MHYVFLMADLSLDLIVVLIPTFLKQQVNLIFYIPCSILKKSIMQNAYIRTLFICITMCVIVLALIQCGKSPRGSSITKRCLTGNVKP